MNGIIKCYTLLKIRSHFHNVFIKGDYIEKGMPVLVISNHLSWWDGFWAMYLNMKLFHRKFYFMMLEEELKKHMFFNKTGGYSVKKGSRSVIESLNYTAELLSCKNNLVILFPQGKIESLYTRDFRFEKGIEYILKKVKGEVQILFLVNLVDYFSEPRPGLFMYFREYTGSGTDTDTLRMEYNDFHSECINENLQKEG